MCHYDRIYPLLPCLVELRCGTVRDTAAASDQDCVNKHLRKQPRNWSTGAIPKAAASSFPGSFSVLRRHSIYNSSFLCDPLLEGGVTAGSGVEEQEAEDEEKL